MPRIAPNPITWVSQCLVFQPLWVQPGHTAVGDEKFTAAGDKVRHRMSGPGVAVQPETAGHRVYHPLATVCKLTPADG
jgi:hypothetical protein